MMSVRIQFFICVLVVLFIITIFRFVSQKKLEMKFALGWMLLGMIVFILALIPDLLKWISKAVGIAAPVNMLFFFGFLFALLIIFWLSMAISHLNNHVKQLTQEIAIMRKQSYNEHMEMKKQDQE